MITVAGVSVPRAAIARLGGQLQPVDPLVATLLGQAIDGNLAELLLHPRDADTILGQLHANPIEELEPLREQLEARPRAREARGALYLVPPPILAGGITTESAAASV